MEMKYPKKKKGQPYPARPRKPSPKGTADSLYNIAIVILIGVSLCLGLGALDYVLQDTTPTADTTETIEYFD